MFECSSFSVIVIDNVSMLDQIIKRNKWFLTWIKYVAVVAEDRLNILALQILPARNHPAENSAWCFKGHVPPKD